MDTKLTSFTSLFKEIYLDKLDNLFGFRILKMITLTENELSECKQLWSIVKEDERQFALRVPLDILNKYVIYYKNNKDIKNDTFKSIVKKIYLHRTTNLGKVLYKGEN